MHVYLSLPPCSLWRSGTPLLEDTALTIWVPPLFLAPWTPYYVTLGQPFPSLDPCSLSCRFGWSLGSGQKDTDSMSRAAQVQHTVSLQQLGKALKGS